MVLTRTELQVATGLSRKAVRVYEEKGILCPIKDTRPHAATQIVYHDDAIAVGRLVATLRRANVSLEDVKRITDLDENCDDEFIAKLKVRLNASAEDMRRAIKTIDAVHQCVKSKIYRTRYGGFWATGVTEKIDKFDLASFLSCTAERLNDEDKPTDGLSLQYKDATECAITACCFVRYDAANRRLSPPFKSYYIPEQVCFGMRAKQSLGNLSGFDRIYEKIQAERVKTGRRKSSTRIIQIAESVKDFVRSDQEIEVVLFS